MTRQHLKDDSFLLAKKLFNCCKNSTIVHYHSASFPDTLYLENEYVSICVEHLGENYDYSGSYTCKAIINEAGQKKYKCYYMPCIQFIHSVTGCIEMYFVFYNPEDSERITVYNSRIMSALAAIFDCLNENAKKYHVELDIGDFYNK